MNHLQLGSNVYTIMGDDGKASPVYYYIEYVGTVNKLKHDPIKLISWGNAPIFANMEHIQLKPSKQGFSYYFAELEDMEQYKCDNCYKVPTKILVSHMKNYVSPWINKF